MENITRKETTDALVAVNRLKAKKLISDNVSDILFRCISVVMFLQEYGNQEDEFEPVRYEKGKEPDCNLCGDYERCAFDREHCTGFIPGIGALGAIKKVPTIKMVPKEGAHKMPEISPIDDVLRGNVRPIIK